MAFVVAVVLDDLHLQAPNVEGNGAQPEEGHGSDRGTVQEGCREGQHHGAAEEEEADKVGSAAV